MAMNQRERFLAIGVGVVAGVFGVQYVYNSVRSSIDAKQNSIDATRTQINKLNQVITQGAIDERKIEALAAKSLPTNHEASLSSYAAWLTEIGRAVGIQNLDVSKKGRPQSTDAYTEFAFSVTGKCKTDQVIDFMAKFYDQDYLHTLRSVNVTPVPRELDMFSVNIEARALSLKAAAEDQEPTGEPSGRLAMDLDQYKAQILGRNPFSPPNKPPTIETSSSLETTVGSSWGETLKGTDAEGHDVDFDVINELPEGMRFRGNSLSFRPQEAGEYEIVVRATDSGFPAMSTEKTIKLVVKEKEKVVETVAEPKFDAATQAFVTAVVNGATGPQAWIHSRTESRRIDVTTGDEIEVGTIKAQVVSINVSESFIEFETDGAHWTIGMDTSLAEGFKKSQID